MSRSARATKGFLASTFQYAIQIAFQAVLAPLILRSAGRETLGAYAVITQVIAYLALVDFGTSVSMGRYLAQSHGLPDADRRFRDVFSTGRSFLLVTNALLSILLLLLSTRVGSFLTLTPGTAVQARYGLQILAAWAVLRTPLAAYNAALCASQDLAAANLIGALQGTMRLLASLVAVRSNLGLAGLLTAGAAGEACGMLLNAWRFHRVQPLRAPSWGLPDRALALEMFRFGAKALLVTAAGQLVFNSGSVILGAVAGTTAVSILYVTQMPTVLAYNCVLRLPDNASPAINELWARRDIDSLRFNFLRLHRVTFLLSLPLSAGILLFNKEFITLWVGTSQYGGTLMTAALAAFVVVISIEHVNVIFTLATGKVGTLGRLGLCEGLATIGLGLFLCHHLGAAGMPLAMVLAISPKTAYLLVLMSRQFNITLSHFVASTFVNALLPCTASVVLALTIHRICGRPSWATLVFGALMFFAVYLGLCYPRAITSDERRQATRWIRAQVARTFSLAGGLV